MRTTLRSVCRRTPVARFHRPPCVSFESRCIRGRHSEPKRWYSATSMETPSDVAAVFHYVDTHTHVHSTTAKLAAQDPAADAAVKSFPEFWADPVSTLAATEGFAIDALVNVCCEPEDIEACEALLEHDHIYGAFGVHPHNAKDHTEEVEAKLCSLMSHPKTRAWGECGLDYYYDLSPRDVQQASFVKQMALAVQHKKPLVVHSREAEEDTVRLMKEHLPVDWCVHVHCFTSSQDMSTALLEHFPNLYIGFTGVITFKSAKKVRRVVQSVPLNRILVETDAPYMTPTPYRGKTCHSGHVPFILRCIAETKGLPLPDVCATIRDNSRSVYGI